MYKIKYSVVAVGDKLVAYSCKMKNVSSKRLIKKTKKFLHVQIRGPENVSSES